MQRRASAFNGYTIEATDGKVGFVSDSLFDDSDWKLRWFVVNTGSWLASRKILIHPSALQQPDVRERAFPVALSKMQVEASPGIGSDEPVSRQMDQELRDYYGYGPTWGGGFYNDDGVGLFGGTASQNTYSQTDERSGLGDPHLRSIVELTGYSIHALDGDIGHLEDFLVDDDGWKIEFAVVDTKNWGFGKHVLIAPAQISEINWGERFVRVDLTCYRIKGSPSWKEPDWSERPEAGVS